MTTVAAPVVGLLACLGVVLLGGPIWAAFGFGVVMSYVVIGWDCDR